MLDVLRQVAAAHDATCAQVALAWLLRRPNVVVIPGASSVAQAEANAAAADLELTDDEDAALTAASDDYRPGAGRGRRCRPWRGPGPSGLAGRVRRAVEGLRELRRIGPCGAGVAPVGWPARRGLPRSRRPARLPVGSARVATSGGGGGSRTEEAR